MANTTFANLKINALRKAGNYYNANDATLLQMAGGIINEIFGKINIILKGHPYTLDIGNTISTVASQAYVAPLDTDIIEILQVYERLTNRKLRQISYVEYIGLSPDPTRFGGVADLAWAPTQTIDVSGNPAWLIYFIPTPSAVMTIYYDYIKNLQFSSDSTSADAEFSKLPPVYDSWIYSEFKPLFYGITDPKNVSLLSKLESKATQDRQFYTTAIMSQTDRYVQVDSIRDTLDYRYNRVATTPIP